MCAYYGHKITLLSVFVTAICNMNYSNPWLLETDSAQFYWNPEREREREREQVAENGESRSQVQQCYHTKVARDTDLLVTHRDMSLITYNETRKPESVRPRRRWEDTTQARITH
jgi:hypothetical protein